MANYKVDLTEGGNFAVYQKMYRFPVAMWSFISMHKTLEDAKRDIARVKNNPVHVE